MALESKFVNVLGYDLHYRAIGSGDRYFLLLHGFASNLYAWRYIMLPLSKYGRVIAFDRLGFGLSAVPKKGSWTGSSPYAPSKQSDFIVGFMDALKIDKAILIGNSQGGTVALSTALAHPSRFERIVVADPAVYTSGGPPPSMSRLFDTKAFRAVGTWLVGKFIAERARIRW